MSKPKKRELPHSLAAEKSVLGAVFVKPDCFAQLRLQPDDFFDLRTAAVWRAFRELAASKTAIDVATVETTLRRANAFEAAGGLPFLADLLVSMPTADNVEHYAQIVLDLAKSREVMRAAAEVIEAGYSQAAVGDELLARLSALVRRIRPARPRAAVSARGLAEARVRELMASSEMAAKGETPGRVLTAIPQLDDRIGGIPRGNHVGLVAMTGHGKTATLTHFAMHAQCPTLTFCFEELQRDQTDRLLSLNTGIAAIDIARGKLTGKELAAIIDAADRMPTDRYYVNARGMADEDVARVARMLAPQLGVGLVIVDYLNRVRLSASPKLRPDERMRHAVGLFDDACGELDVAWITAAQVNRDPGKTARMPRISDARECAALEEYSKVGIVVYRPKHGTDDDNELWVYIDKANIGGQFYCKCNWHGPTMKITPRDSVVVVGEEQAF